MADIGIRIRAIADTSDAVSKFGALSNSIASSSRAFNNSLQTGNTNSAKDYADLQLSLRNQYLKDAKIGGYSEIKLDSKPMETGIRSLEAVINQMITEGRSKEAKEYGGILKDLQHQYNLENEDDSDKKNRIAQDQQTRFIRGMSRFMGQGSNLIGQAGGGNVAGAALGAAGGATDLIGMLKGNPALMAGAGIVGAVVGLGAAANKLSEQWEKMMQPSMGLAASLGELGSDAKRNSAVFKEVFNRATDARVLHGYKLEEGLQLANDLSKTGVKTENIYRAESNVLGYQRATDADRGTLTKAVGLSERYRGGENILGLAYGGLKESGMQSGQYQEYLSATLRIFEEGLSKGVVKGFAEITRTQNMLAAIGETWKGEAGLEKRQGIDSAISGAYNLEGEHDVIMYRAAQSVAKQTMSDPSYGDIAKILDEGIDGPKGDDLLREVGKIIRQIGNGKEGEQGNQTEIMTAMRSFNLTFTAAEEFFNAIIKKDFGSARAVMEDPKSKGVKTTEEDLLTVTEQIRQDIILFGSNFTEAKLGVLSGLSKITNLIGGDRAFAASSVKTMDVMTEIGVTGNLAIRKEAAFQKAYTAKNQPDDDNNGEGDYGQRARDIQGVYEELPAGYKYWAAMHPDNPINQGLNNLDSKGIFTDEDVRMAKEGKEFAEKEIGGKSEEDLRREYFNHVISSIQDNPRDKKDERLRYYIENYQDEASSSNDIFAAIEKMRATGSTGGAMISAKDEGFGFTEIKRLIGEFEKLLPELKKIPDAIIDSGTVEVLVREDS